MTACGKGNTAEEQWAEPDMRPSLREGKASVFCAYFACLGLDLTPEESSNAGQLDMAPRVNGNIYLFEFKAVERAPEGRAPRNWKSEPNL